MRNLFLFFFITLLTGSPLIALLVILALYLALDNQFIGISRRFFEGFRRGSAIRRGCLWVIDPLDILIPTCDNEAYRDSLRV